MTRLLWDALGDVPDRRGRQGRQYELRSVLGIALAAMLAGANDLRAIWRWGRRLRPEALRLFGIESGRSPCHASYHDFFQALDADALAATLGRTPAARRRAGTSRSTARRCAAAAGSMPRRCMCSRPSRPSSGR